MDQANTYTYIFYILLAATIIIGIVLFSISSSPDDAVQRAKNTSSTYEKVLSLSPLGDNDYKLCDYFIASSAYTVFPGDTPSDYISDQIIPLVVKSGARLVELDVYDDGGIPVVGLKNQMVGYDYAKNSVTLEKCCIAIGNSAFSGSLSSDPFILSLMFHTENNNTINASARIIKDTLARFLLGPEYSFHRKNLAQEPMKNLMRKLIIVSGGAIKHTKMQELVNLSWSTSDLRRLTYMQASQPYDHQELVNSNKKSICMVVPDPDPDLKNYNPTILYSYGCQWNLMNFGSPDTMMELHMEKFQQGSIILKPDELRFQPVEAKVPVLPDPATHSFQPMAHTSPIYDMNPATGDKSIVI
jgi:hypothetical protein